MNTLLSKFLYLSKPVPFCKEKFRFHGLTFLLALFYSYSHCQSLNQINNGSFEEVLSNTATPLFYSAKYWGATDSTKFSGELLSLITLPIKVPNSSYTYQWPKHGSNQMIGLHYCPTCSTTKRGYIRNRLKYTLKPNTNYCFSMYVNLSNHSSYAIDAIGAYFSDASIDTISECNIALTYISPQIQNPQNNVVTDTLNWILVQGQFTSNGTEKYAMIGNFKGDSLTNKILVNPTFLPSKFTSYLFDYISLIETNIQPFAGRDTIVFPGDSIFLGREPEVGLDEACTWYKLPNLSPLDTVAGFWLKPTETCTYVVRQEICGMVKWDTVRIFMDAVSLEKFDLERSWQVTLSPNPAQHQLFFTNNNKDEILDITISDLTGRIVKSQKLKTLNHKANIYLDLTNGAYFITIYNSSNEKITKHLLIAK